MVEEIQHRSFLEPQGLHDGEDAFDETAAVVAMTAEGVFAPEHARSEQAFDVVVGRVDAFVTGEGPQGGFDGQQVFTKDVRLGVIDRAAGRLRK